MTRTVLIFIAVLLAVLPVAAQESPRFFIERIEVRNARRVSADVVIAESRLSAGREYSEAELRDASTRLSRLPFLLSVDFALEKGSERGQHVLVLSIVETKPFFFAWDARTILTDDYVEIDSGDAFNGQNEAVLGFRWFVGRRGAVHVGLFGGNDAREYIQDYASVAVGYTQYDLFGTRAFATLNLKRRIEGYANSGEITPEVVVGIPLSPNQTLTLQADQTQFSRTKRFFGPEAEWACMAFEDCRTRVEDEQRSVSARWTYNTTNSPFIPTRGTIVAVSPIVRFNEVKGDRNIYSFDVEGNFLGVSQPTAHRRTVGIDGLAERYWELSERNSVAASVAGSFARFETRYDQEWDLDERPEDGYSAIVRGRFIHSLWPQERRRDGDSLLEMTVSYARRDHTERPESPADTRQLSASWVRRSSWGTLRLGAGYAW